MAYWMDKARLLLGKARLFLSDSDRRKYVLLLVGFILPLFWFAVEFEEIASTKEAAWKLKAGAFTTTVIGTPFAVLFLHLHQLFPRHFLTSCI